MQTKAFAAARQPVPADQSAAGFGQVARADVHRPRQALQPGPEEGDRRGPRALDRRLVREHRPDLARILRRLGDRGAEQPLHPRRRGGEGRRGRAVPRGRRPILVCTHATLRFAHDAIDESALDEVLLAIDEFHHVSSAENSRLGELLRSVMANTSAHIVAMTGSYFRGDAVPVLEASDEAKFTKVTYNYYEQLNGYNHLRSLGIGYHFYQGPYTDGDRRGPRHSTRRRSSTSRTSDPGSRPRTRCARSTRSSTRSEPIIAQDPATGVIEVRSRGRARAQGRGPRQRRPGASGEDRRLPAHDVRGRRHRPDHRAGDGEGGLRLALLRTRPDGRLPRLAHRDHPDHRPLHPRQPEQDAHPVHQPDRSARRRRRGGAGRGQQHAEGDHRLAADGAGARARTSTSSRSATRTTRADPAS